MTWTELSTPENLQALIKNSYQAPVLIYKHSIRCSLSSVTRSRLERSWQEDPLSIACYFLDLVTYREVSNEVETQLQVRHQSPQVLIVYQGTCTYHGSHFGISHSSIKEALIQLPVQNQGAP